MKTIVRVLVIAVWLWLFWELWFFWETWLRDRIWYWRKTGIWIWRIPKTPGSGRK